MPFVEALAAKNWPVAFRLKRNHVRLSAFTASNLGEYRAKFLTIHFVSDAAELTSSRVVLKTFVGVKYLFTSREYEIRTTGLAVQGAVSKFNGHSASCTLETVGRGGRSRPGPKRHDNFHAEARPVTLAST